MTISRDFDVDPRKLSSPYLRLLFDYWDALRRGRVAPQAEDLDPLDIPPAALPYVILIDLTPDPLRVRYRLVGTHGVEAAGWDYTGRYVDELEMPNDMVREVEVNFTYAVRQLPMFAWYDWPLKGNGGIVRVELIQLPLLQDGIVTRCFCAEHVGQDQDLTGDEIVPIGMTG